MRRHAGANATTNYIASTISSVTLDVSSLKETGQSWKATSQTSLASHGHPGHLASIPAAKFRVNLLDVGRLLRLQADVQMARI